MLFGSPSFEQGDDIILRNMLIKVIRRLGAWKKKKFVLLKVRHTQREGPPSSLRDASRLESTCIESECRDSRRAT